MELRRLLFSMLIIVLIFIGGCNSELEEDEEEETIDVQIDVEGVIGSGRVYFEGETNLPDQAQLIFSVEGNGYKHKTKGVVRGSTFESGLFSNKGESLEAGTYELSILLSAPSIQDDRFLEIAGETYENLSGELMEEADLGKNLSYSNTFTVEAYDQKFYLPALDAKEIMTARMEEQNELIEISVIHGEIIAKIELQNDETPSGKELAIKSYAQISEDLLEREDWEALTIEYVDIGTISMNRSEKETNENGDYFPKEAIENNLLKE